MTDDCSIRTGTPVGDTQSPLAKRINANPSASARACARTLRLHGPVSAYRAGFDLRGDRPTLAAKGHVLGILRRGGAAGDGDGTPPNACRGEGGTVYPTGDVCHT